MQWSWGLEGWKTAIPTPLLPSLSALSASMLDTKTLFSERMMHLESRLSAGTHELLHGRTTLEDTLPMGSTHICFLLRGIRWNPTVLLPPATSSWGQEPLSWKMMSHHTRILTELALLGLGQGLPAPGPLREGERETMKAVLQMPSRDRGAG